MAAGAEGDVGEVRAWCARCGEVRTFAKGTLEVEPASSPDVGHALGAEQAWMCRACGLAKVDPVERAAYPVAFANVSAVRGLPAEGMAHGEGVSDDLALRAAAGEGVVLHEPATEEEQEALHHDPAVEATLQDLAPGDDDASLERAVLEDARRAERGEVALGLEHGPRRPLRPPARVPARDPTFREAAEHQEDEQERA